MAQTRITSDFCSYNQSAAPFYYTMEPMQYSNTYTFGEVGISAAGGSAGSFVRSDVIDIDSFLSGRDDILSRCNPPVPGLDEVAREPLVMQKADISLLVSKDTREKKSAIDLSSIDYNRWDPNLPVDPQNLRFVIEDFAAQRGGLDTQNYSKLAWKPTVARGAAVDGPSSACKTILDPSRACGSYCSSVSGYNSVANLPVQRPQSDYPFEGITSQQVKAVGASSCGPQQFWGSNYDKGSCGLGPQQRVLLNSDKMAVENDTYLTKLNPSLFK